jgi:hypothetical protein
LSKTDLVLVTHNTWYNQPAAQVDLGKPPGIPKSEPHYLPQEGCLKFNSCCKGQARMPFSCSFVIARAILKDPKIMLLDEATSSVDTKTEVEIQQVLDKLTEGRTTFIVAHRLSTVMNADLMLVIQDGGIVEQGSPKELLKAKGKYYDLWSKQNGIVPTPADPEVEHRDVSKRKPDNDGNPVD